MLQLAALVVGVGHCTEYYYSFTLYVQYRAEYIEAGKKGNTWEIRLAAWLVYFSQVRFSNVQNDYVWLSVEYTRVPCENHQVCLGLILGVQSSWFHSLCFPIFSPHSSCPRLTLTSLLRKEKCGSVTDDHQLCLVFFSLSFFLLLLLLQSGTRQSSGDGTKSLWPRGG